MGRRGQHPRHDATPRCSTTSRASRAALVEAGFPYLKLDFTYAPSIRGGYADPCARRRSGCGPASTRSAAVPATTRSCSAAARRSARRSGVVDGMRIGADVAPWWHPQDDQYRPPGLHGRRAGHRERVAQHAEPLLPAPPALAQRPGLPDAAHRATTDSSRSRSRTWALAVGVSAAGWRWCPTTWPCSVRGARPARRGPGLRARGGRRAAPAPLP